MNANEQKIPRRVIQYVGRRKKVTYVYDGETKATNTATPSENEDASALDNEDDHRHTGRRRVKPSDHKSTDTESKEQ